MHTDTHILWQDHDTISKNEDERRGEMKNQIFHFFL